MDAEILKKEITEKINRIEDEDTLLNLDQIVNELMSPQHRLDFWDDLTEEQKSNIEVSLRQIREGKTIPHEKVQAEARQWLKK